MQGDKDMQRYISELTAISSKGKKSTLISLSNNIRGLNNKVKALSYQKRSLSMKIKLSSNEGAIKALEDVKSKVNESMRFHQIERRQKQNAKKFINGKKGAVYMVQQVNSGEYRIRADHFLNAKNKEAYIYSRDSAFFAKQNAKGNKPNKGLTKLMDASMTKASLATNSIKEKIALWKKALKKGLISAEKLEWCGQHIIGDLEREYKLNGQSQFFNEMLDCLEEVERDDNGVPMESSKGSKKYPVIEEVKMVGEVYKRKKMKDGSVRTVKVLNGFPIFERLYVGV
jgi:hypothetical protein